MGVHSHATLGFRYTNKFHEFKHPLFRFGLGLTQMFAEDFGELSWLVDRIHRAELLEDASRLDDVPGNFPDDLAEDERQALLNFVLLCLLP